MRETDDPDCLNDRALATYWFAKLIAALDDSDYVLASLARDRLRESGFDVRTRPARKRGQAKR